METRDAGCATFRDMTDDDDVQRVREAEHDAPLADAATGLARLRAAGRDDGATRSERMHAARERSGWTTGRLFVTIAGAVVVGLLGASILAPWFVAVMP